MMPRNGGDYLGERYLGMLPDHRGRDPDQHDAVRAQPPRHDLVGMTALMAAAWPNPPIYQTLT
jgi:hypothetical protein